jgi:hypothetical protein
MGQLDIAVCTTYHDFTTHSLTVRFSRDAFRATGRRKAALSFLVLSAVANSTEKSSHADERTFDGTA